MIPKSILSAISPVIRVTKDHHVDVGLHKGDLCELIDGGDDYYAVADDLHGKPYWISMCIVHCEPVNQAALDFYAMAGWPV